MAGTPASDLSGPTEADGDFAIFDDDRNLSRTLRDLQHLLEGLCVLLHIDVANSDIPFGVLLPGRRGKRSPILPVDDDVGCHQITSVIGY